jgi:HNH/ENDO VII superfamily nuclease with conserved GHE residues
MVEDSRPSAENWSRERLSDYINNPDIWQIENAANNLSHRFELPRATE